MSIASEPPRTLGELLRRLGDIPPDRVRFQPPPGTATVQDVLDNKCCELIEGVLVEKAMGWSESFLAIAIAQILRNFPRSKNLGVLTGADSTQQIAPSLVRIPDVSFFSWDRMPGRKLPTDPVPLVVPDLAVEVLSKGNTPGEMRRKRQEYFQAGVRLVWEIDPGTRTIQVFTSATDVVTLAETDQLSGGEVLPGFNLPVGDLFAELDAQG